MLLRMVQHTQGQLCSYSWSSTQRVSNVATQAPAHTGSVMLLLRLLHTHRVSDVATQAPAHTGSVMLLLMVQHTQGQ